MTKPRPSKRMRPNEEDPTTTLGRERSPIVDTDLAIAPNTAAAMNVVVRALSIAFGLRRGRGVTGGLAHPCNGFSQFLDYPSRQATARIRTSRDERRNGMTLPPNLTARIAAGGAVALTAVAASIVALSALTADAKAVS